MVEAFGPFHNPKSSETTLSATYFPSLLKFSFNTSASNSLGGFCTEWLSELSLPV
jgi:hypothetical protein